MVRWQAAVLAAAVLGGASAAPLAAQDPTPVTIESFTLPNGLRVHLVEDHSAQVVAVNLWYDVGSRNERPGRTGFAHLFEHMMFQGSEHVGKMEHGQLIERAGGTFNGSTQPDRTDYWQTVPSNRLNLALWLEADRMRSLTVTQEKLDNQRSAVQEERRLRVDNQPYTGALVDTLPAVFGVTSCFAYAHSMIGSMDDLNAATVEDVQTFFDTYYAPNNASLVIVGDFQPATARRLVREYFSDIPRGADAPAVSCTAPTFGQQAMERKIVDAKAVLPAVIAAYRTVPPAHADFPALDLLATVLGAGESSRLNRTLVRTSRVAVATQATLNPFGPMRGTGMFIALAVANQGQSAEAVRDRLAREVNMLANELTAEELEKARSAWRAQTIFGRQQALGVSEAVHYAALFLGGPEAVNQEALRYRDVTLEDLRRVARTYLRPDNALTLLIVPPEGR